MKEGAFPKVSGPRWCGRDIKLEAEGHQKERRVEKRRGWEGTGGEREINTRREKGAGTPLHVLPGVGTEGLRPGDGRATLPATSSWDVPSPGRLARACDWSVPMSLGRRPG